MPKKAAVGLTPMEEAVAELVSEGLTNLTVAARLEIGEDTVKAHLQSVFRKMGVSTRLELAVVRLKQKHAEELRAIRSQYESFDLQSH